MIQRLPVQGLIRLYRTPDDCSPEDFRAWWPRLTEQDKARYREGFQVPKFDRHQDVTGEFVWAEETPNIITNNGITNLLKNIVNSATSALHPYQQIMSVGNGAIAGVSRTDTAVAGDGFATGARKAPTGQNLTGFQGLSSINYLTTDAVGTWTNMGFYGYNWGTTSDATTTTGTGWLTTHALVNYTKLNTVAITIDYVTVLSN